MWCTQMDRGCHGGSAYGRTPCHRIERRACGMTHGSAGLHGVMRDIVAVHTTIRVNS